MNRNDLDDQDRAFPDALPGRRADSAIGGSLKRNGLMTPIAVSFSDGSNGRCDFENKRGLWPAEIPATVSIRKSDDALKYRCTTSDGRAASGAIESEMGGKIIASAVFLDFGITDAITDKHRKYTPSFVIPIRRIDDPVTTAAPAPAEVFETEVDPAASSAEEPSEE